MSAHESDLTTPWTHEAVVAVARAIHDDGGGCCEYGYDRCADQSTAEVAALVGLSCWLGHSFRLGLYPVAPPSSAKPPCDRCTNEATGGDIGESGDVLWCDEHRTNATPDRVAQVAATAKPMEEREG